MLMQGRLGWFGYNERTLGKGRLAKNVSKTDLKALCPKREIAQDRKSWRGSTTQSVLAWTKWALNGNDDEDHEVYMSFQIPIYRTI